MFEINMDHNFFIILMYGFCVMCSCSDTGNMQLSYNSPGGYLVQVLFSQFVFFPMDGPEFQKTPAGLDFCSLQGEGWEPVVYCLDS